MELNFTELYEVLLGFNKSDWKDFQPKDDEKNWQNATNISEIPRFFMGVFENF